MSFNPNIKRRFRVYGIPAFGPSICLGEIESDEIDAHIYGNRLLDSALERGADFIHFFLLFQSLPDDDHEFLQPETHPGDVKLASIVAGILRNGERRPSELAGFTGELASRLNAVLGEDDRFEKKYGKWFLRQIHAD